MRSVYVNGPVVSRAACACHPDRGPVAAHGHGFKSVSHRLDILNGTVASHQKDIQLIRDTMVKEVDYATDRTNDRTERRDTRTDNTQAWRVFVAPIVSGLALALALKMMACWQSSRSNEELMYYKPEDWIARTFAWPMSPASARASAVTRPSTR